MSFPVCFLVLEVSTVCPRGCPFDLHYSSFSSLARQLVGHGCSSRKYMTVLQVAHTFIRSTFESNCPRGPKSKSDPRVCLISLSHSISLALYTVLLAVWMDHTLSLHSEGLTLEPHHQNRALLEIQGPMTENNLGLQILKCASAHHGTMLAFLFVGTLVLYYSC